MYNSLKSGLQPEFMSRLAPPKRPENAPEKPLFRRFSALSRENISQKYVAKLCRRENFAEAARGGAKRVVQLSLHDYSSYTPRGRASPFCDKPTQEVRKFPALLSVFLFAFRARIVYYIVLSQQASAAFHSRAPERNTEIEE